MRNHCHGRTSSLGFFVFLFFWGYFYVFFFGVDFFSKHCKYTRSDMNVAKLIEEGLSFSVI